MGLWVNFRDTFDLIMQNLEKMRKEVKAKLIKAKKATCILCRGQREPGRRNANGLPFRTAGQR